MKNLPDFAKLLETHLKMQSGCYFSRIDVGPSGVRYACSDLIPDIAWNFAVSPLFIDASVIDWVARAAAARQRTPALLVPEDIGGEMLSSDSRFKEAIPERWMVFSAKQKIQPIPDIPHYLVRSSKSSRPDPDFLKVFENLFDDSQLNKHFAKHYVPALAAATDVAGVSSLHFVGYLNKNPVSCASVYFCGPYAGLYNVGTWHTEQKKSLGRAISLHAMQRAIERGPVTVFLQCEVGTHVESLYQSIGFTITNTPRAFVFHA
jgi:hypothetical protein